MTKNEIFNKEDETFLRLIRTISIIVSFMLIPIISIELAADEIKFGFKNPSFSGVGTGNHYLTIDNIEHTRKKAIEDALEAARRAAEREEDNSVLAKFIRNLESRIYAQMAKQLVESMFSNDDSVRFGSFVLEGSTVTYEVITNADGSEVIRMTIITEDGSETIIEIPVGAGNFSQDPDDG